MKAVAIVAFGPTGKCADQFVGQPDWEIWGMNDGNRHPSMFVDGKLIATRWFELHNMHAQDDSDWDWLARCPVPVYIPPVDFPCARIPNAVRFPIEEVEALAPQLQPFWACTFSYQIALALAEGFDTIALLGFEFGSPREWLLERANVLFWVGVAAGRGVTLVIPERSTLMQHPKRYGLEYDAEVLWANARVEGLINYWLKTGALQIGRP